MPQPPGIKELWTSPAIERMFSHSGIGFMLVGLDQRVLDASTTFCEMLGYELEELRRLRVSDYTHPDDLEMTEALFLHAAQGNLQQAFEKRYRRKDGSYIWCRLHSQPLPDSEGAPRYRFVMAEDISARKRDEINLEQLAAITEASDDAIFRTDPDNIIQYWSKGAERMYGYSSAEALGRPAGFIAATDPRFGMQQNLERAEKLLKRGEVVADPDVLGRHKDGHVIAVSVLIFPIKGKQGQVIAHAAVHRDISAFKELQLQLRHSQRLETAGLLAGGIAHDFNNIITVIQGASELLARDCSGANLRPHIALIQRSAEQAARLTRQLLAFSRKQQLSPVVVDPNTLITESTALLKHALGDDISLNTALRAQGLIREDDTQFEQVLMNLAVNARHAMPKGGMLSITTDDVVFDTPPRPGDPRLPQYLPTPVEAGAYVKISVTDTGCGIEAATLERIFDPFFTTKPPGEGTGLGLSVVYGMATQTGGALGVSSRPGQGTRFDLFLPRVADTLPPASGPTPPHAAQQHSGRILVVEDDDGVRQLTAALLHRAGYTVFQASNPLEVLDGRVESDVDLILSDVMMPNLSGPEFARQWLQRRPEARFMFMSGYFDDQAFADGLRDKKLIRKPFRSATLIEAVASELATSRG